MYNDLKGKTALVTGAGKKTGIGFGIAENLATNGCNLIVADLGTEGRNGGVVAAGNVEGMEAIAEELQQRFSIATLAVSVDVTSNASLQKMVAAVSSQFPHVDILCNNAGAVFGVPNAIHTYESMFRYIGANIAGMVYGSASEIGDVEKQPELMQKAYQLGEKLATMG